MIPPDRLPYVSGRGPVEEAELAKIFSDGSSPVPFTLNRNLRVYVSSVLCKLEIICLTDGVWLQILQIKCKLCFNID